MVLETHAAMDDKERKVPWGYVIILGILAFAGFTICMNLLGSYGEDKNGLLRSEWFCGDTSTFNYGCSGVFASRFGKIFGVPLPAFGVLYFASLLLWLVFFGRRSFNILLALLLAGGAATSLGLLFILYFVLPGQCRWCLLIHLVNGLLIFTTVVVFVRFGGLRDFRDFRYVLTKGSLVAFIVLAAAGWSLAGSYRRSMNQAVGFYEKVRLSECYQRGLYSSQKARDITINADDHILGSRAARVRIVVYQDYQCDHCRKAANLLHKAFEKANAGNKRNVSLVIRHYPLSYRCNKYMRTDLHPYACAAAHAAEAVFLAGGEKAFWAYHDLLHKHHADLDQNPYLALAQEVGISEASFREALASPKIKERIERDIASMHALGFRAVPTIFINGRFLDGWQVPGFVDNLIKEELAAAATRPGNSSQR